MKTNKLIIGGCLLLLFAAPVFAVLQVNFETTFDVDKINDRVDYFWKGDPNKANQSGRLINASPDTDFDDFTNVNKQAKVGNTPQTSIVYFGADEDYPGAGTISIRVWEDTSRISYTTLKSFTNSTGGSVEEDFGSQTCGFTKAVPAPEVYKIDLSTVKEGESETTELKFYSKGNLVDGKTVEIDTRAWSVKYNGEEVEADKLTGAATSTLVLSSAKGNLFGPGDKYEVTVVYTGLWPEIGTGSAAETYTVPAPAEEVSLDLKSLTGENKTGINNFSIPFAGPWYAYKGDGTAIEVAEGEGNEKYQITLPLHLVKAINAVNDINVVSTFGLLVENTQVVKGTMIEYVDGAITESEKVGGFKGLGEADEALAKDEVYQVYVTADTGLVIKNTAPAE